jgi:hypothetical protein
MFVALFRRFEHQHVRSLPFHHDVPTIRGSPCRDAGASQVSRRWLGP